ncbi:MAG: AAA family ATPase [Pseudomonadota bacterium]
MPNPIPSPDSASSRTPAPSLSHRLCVALIRCQEARKNGTSPSRQASPTGFQLSDSEPVLSYFGPHTYDDPMAALMSEKEVTDALAKGIDPWAQSQGAALPTTSCPTLLFDLLCAVKLARAFPEGPIDTEPFPPGVTLLQIPDRSKHEEVASTLDHVLPFYMMARTAQDIQLTQIIHGAPSGPNRSSTSNAQAQFRSRLDSRLTEYQVVIAIATDPSDLSDSGQMLLNKAVDWPLLTQDILIDLLRITHSTTGQLAETYLRTRLPKDADLARLPWPLLVHALGANSTLRVADRLASCTARPKQKTGLSLDDVHGLPDIVSGLRQLADDVAAWEADVLDWSEVSSSILFHGPPGTGKTMLAEAFAGTAGATFISTSYAECQKAGHLGDYLKAMSDNVERAIAQAPSVFFVDELDSYRDRTNMSGRESGYMRAVVNGMLEHLSRLNDAPGVVVMAATNEIDTIDPALIRAGRFDQKIAVGLPDKTGVENILRGHLGHPDVELGTLPLELVGLSGAEIAAVARSAKGHARAARSGLTVDHVRTAIHDCAPAPSADVMRRKAIHEAGHAVVAHALGLLAGKRLYLSAFGGGYDAPRDGLLTRELAERELAMILAGRAAEILVCGNASSGAGGNQHSDLARATELALEMDYTYGLGPSLFHGTPAPEDRLTLPDDVKDRIEGVLQRASKTADKVVRQNRDRLLHVAQELLKHRELDAGQLADALSMAGNKSTQRSVAVPHV